MIASEEGGSDVNDREGGGDDSDVDYSKGVRATATLTMSAMITK